MSLLQIENAFSSSKYHVTAKSLWITLTSTFIRVDESRGINSFMLLTVGPDGIMTLVQLEERQRGERGKGDRRDIAVFNDKKHENAKH